MLKKIKNFLKNYDIRWKLIKISNLIKINLYPKKFRFNSIHKLQTKIIFNLIFFSSEKSFQYHIFAKKKYE